MGDGFAISPVPIRPVSDETRTRKPSSTSSSATQDPHLRRDLKEAERLISTGKIKGAEATRVRALIDQAEISTTQGEVSEAQRLADQALDVARDEQGTLFPVSSGPKEEGKESGSTAETAPQDEKSQAEQEPLLKKQESSIYRDASSDSGISFKTGAPLTEEQAPFAVRAHETAHLLHETQEAILHGHKVYQTVRILSQIDPTTGERHIAGGRAIVTIFPKTDPTPAPKSQIDLEA
ncbi:MAG TPA: hypothetical protein PLG59_09115 [bacterium]|nr:hypothetical protein [bacterium]HQQ00897.1 hypothetical protein [bacterium]